MSGTNEKINRQLRRQTIRRVLLVLITAVSFIAFMSYALYREYGPDAEIIDYFPEHNTGDASPG